MNIHIQLTEIQSKKLQQYFDKQLNTSLVEETSTDLIYQITHCEELGTNELIVKGYGNIDLGEVNVIFQ